MPALFFFLYVKNTMNTLEKISVFRFFRYWLGDEYGEYAEYAIFKNPLYEIQYRFGLFVIKLIIQIT